MLQYKNFKLYLELKTAVVPPLNNCNKPQKQPSIWMTKLIPIEYLKITIEILI